MGELLLRRSQQSSHLILKVLVQLLFFLQIKLHTFHPFDILHAAAARLLLFSFFLLQFSLRLFEFSLQHRHFITLLANSTPQREHVVLDVG